MQVPLTLTIFFIVIVASVFLLLFVGFRGSIRKTYIHAPKKGKQKLQNVTLSILLWLILLGTLASLGIFNNFSTLPPRPAIILFVPLIVLIIFTLTSGFIKKLLLQTPQHWLIHAQIFRLPIEIFLWQVCMEGVIGTQMTFEGYNFDVLVALTAPIMAFLCCHRKILPHSFLILWNIAGLALVTTIVVIAVLSMPTPLRYFTEGPSNTFVAFFPFIWLPGFLVINAYFLHVASLRQIFLKRKAS